MPDPKAAYAHNMADVRESVPQNLALYAQKRHFHVAF
jgi:hypothetical protein